MIQRARLTLLKRFSHSTKPSKIKENLADLQTIRVLYEPLRTVLGSLDLTPDGIRYYAQAVIKSEVFQISRRTDAERHLHLLCFVAHQYFHLHDLLLDAFLRAVQSTRSTSLREHQQQYYDERTQRQQAIRSLVENMERAVFQALAHIERIAFQQRLPDAEKVRLIQDVLRQRAEEREALQDQLTQFKKELQDEQEERSYYAVLESKSIKLQNKVAGILQQVRFQGTEEALLEAVRHYQAKAGDLTATAPTAFLNDDEKRLLTEEKGKFRISLYKTLLFFKTADAVKSGTLHVEESYRYRSLDDYLIPCDQWERRRTQYLHQADLTGVADCRALFEQRAALLDQQYILTNRHILEGRNEHITFHKDGGSPFHVSTPKEDDSDTASLSSFFPEDRYISLLEVLATVNRHSQFLDAFQHWQVKYTKKRPPERVFLAGIIGYGCQIGTGKVARISNQISSSELERTINCYFSRDNVAEANDKILALMDQLPLPQLYRRHHDQLHTSSDGQKVEVGVDSLNANYSYKYFGQSKGASAYTFIDERHFLFHSTVISSPEKEAAYVINGLMHNDVVKSDIHSTDTGGYTHGQRVLLDNSGNLGRLATLGLVVVNHSPCGVWAEASRRTNHGEASRYDGGRDPRSFP